MIKNIIQQLKKNGCCEIIFSEEYLKKDIISIFGKENSHHIADVRSATFFAFGQAKIHCNSVLLVVNEEYISNCYTALMEAWMQRSKIIVVSYNSSSYKSTLYLERCVDYVTEIKDIDSIPSILNLVNTFKGPILLKVPFIVNNDNKIDYNQIITSLYNTYDNNGILCYNAKEENLNIKGVINIEQRHKYGVLSKYIGMLASGKRYILCIPDYLLLLETNVFNLRNIPSTFMVVIIGTNDKIMDMLEPWIDSNHIKVMHKNESSHICEEAICINPTILYLNENRN